MSNEITWQAPEYVHYPKSAVWFATLSLIGAGLIVFFLFKKDFLTAALFFLLTLTVFFFSRKKPGIVTVKLASTGLTYNEARLPWQKIQSFWIVYEPPEIKTLNFKTSAYLNRLITIQLDDADPAAIHEFLLQYLPEDENQEEQFADKIARKLKF